MNCEEARQRWHLSLDSGQEDVELSAHIISCDACRAYDSQMRRLVGALDELRRESEEVTSHNEAPVRIGSPPSIGSRGYGAGLRLMRVAAVLALIVAGGLYFGNRYLGEGDAPTPIADSSGSEVHQPTLRLRGESAEKYLVVSTPTSEADVQMFWLYPLLSSEGSDDRS
jgi:hypothetical protein